MNDCVVYKDKTVSAVNDYIVYQDKSVTAVNDYIDSLPRQELNCSE